MSSPSLPPVNSDEAATTADGGVVPPAPMLSAPSTLGRYAVLDTLGAGGMGVVVRAYDPKLQREVAIKQLRSDALDERAADRMIREAQAMAQLAHPNVVAVHDVEVLDSTVLLIMEYVEGGTLRGWLADHEPAWTETLSIFVQAGRGLAAAHEAGLVHRDFKPDNVLVGRDGRVRVTDFGLARAVEDASPPVPSQRLQSLSGSYDSLSAPMTIDGTVMGTPIFMAPEQQLGEGATAAADQFAFCVALWAALTGDRPYTGDYKTLAKAKLAGPPTWPQSAASRVVPKEIIDALTRGLMPDPDERWPSMTELLTVLDRDRSRGRSPGLTTAVLGVATIVIVSAAALASRSSSAVCTGAREHLSGVWDGPRKAAVTESLEATGLQYAEATGTQISETLDAYADAWVGMHTEACEATSVRGEQSSEVLDLRMACLGRLKVRLDATAEILADADATIVERAVSLTTSLPPVSRCADVGSLRSTDSRPEDPEQARAVEQARDQLARARVQREAGRQEEAMALVAALEPSALEHPPTRVAAAAERAHCLLDLSRYDDAEQVLTEVYPLAIQTSEHPTSVIFISLLSFVVGARQMREPEARWLGQAALAMAQRHEDLRMEAIVRNDLGGVLETHAHIDEAFEQFERVLQIQREIYGSEPSLPIATTLANLALTSSRSGDFDRALALRREVLEIETAILGDEHPDIARSKQALGHLLHHRGEYAASLTVLEQALDLRTRLQGPDHPETTAARASVATTLTALGRLEEAEAHLRAALAMFERNAGADSIEVTDVLNNLAIVVEAQGHYEECLALHRRSLKIVERVMGPAHPRTAAGLNNVGGALVNLRREQEALPLLRRSVEVMKKVPGQHPNRAIFEFNLGDALNRLGRHDEAEPILRQTLAFMEEAFGPDHLYLSYPMVSLGQLLHARDGDSARAQARPLLERGLEIRTTHNEPPAKRADAAFALARVLWGDEAERPRARRLAHEARDLFAESGPGHVPDREDVDAWLAGHPAPGGAASP